MKEPSRIRSSPYGACVAIETTIGLRISVACQIDISVHRAMSRTNGSGVDDTGHAFVQVERTECLVAITDANESFRA